jgi:histone H3/H4
MTEQKPEKRTIIFRDSIQGITKPAIRRLAQRAGIIRLSGKIYEKLRGIIKRYVDSVLSKAISFTTHQRRKTVKPSDLEGALQVSGQYLEAATNPNTSKTFNTCKTRHKSKKEPKEQSEKATHHRFKPGTVSLREIRYQQKHSDCFAFPKVNFKRLAREIGQDYEPNLRYSRKFMELFQLVVENYIIELLQSVNLCAIHENRQTVMPKDLELVLKIRKEFVF